MPANVNMYEGPLSAPGLVPDAVYTKALLKMLQLEKFAFASYGIAKSLPMSNGKTMNFRRYAKLQPKTTPLNEGVPPTPDMASATSLTARVNQYGAYMQFTDLAEDELFDDVKKEYLRAQGVQAQYTLDEIVKKELETNGSPFFVNGNSYATIDVADGKAKPSIDTLRKACLVMSENHIAKHEKGAGKYVVLIDEACMFDLYDDTRVEKYMQFGMTNRPMVENWIADMFGMRFIENPNASTSEETLKDEAKHMTHNTFVLGYEAYAVVKLGGKDVQYIAKERGSAGTADPLNQVSTIGWKVQGYCAKVLTALAIQKVIFVPTNE